MCKPLSNVISHECGPALICHVECKILVQLFIDNKRFSVVTILSSCFNIKCSQTHHALISSSLLLLMAYQLMSPACLPVLGTHVATDFCQAAMGAISFHDIS